MISRGAVHLGKHNVADIDSIEAFDELIAQLETKARSHPVMIDIIADDGRGLTLGLGRDMTVLSLTGRDGDPPYYASLGNEHTEGMISFDYGGEKTNFRLRHAVPFRTAHTAVIQFLSQPGLPEAVRWEEV